MPAAKSGTSQQLVTPAAPRTATEADDADPGKVENIKAIQKTNQTGKYGSTPAKVFTPPTDNPTDAGPAGAVPTANPDKPTSWIEIVMVNEAGQPVAGESYSITLPDGSVSQGTLDENGLARVDGFEPGSCQVSFPKRDTAAWEAK